jgi:Yip1-like protein
MVFIVQAVSYSPHPGTHAGRYAKKPRKWIGRDTVTHRVLAAWFDMRASTRRMIIEKPSEARLLFLLLWSDLAFFLSWTLKAVVVPNAAGVSLISVEIGLLFLVAVIGRTAAMYLFAMLAGAIARLLGGRGTWRNTRVAVFWGAFVTAPFGVAAALLSVLFLNLEVYYPIFGAKWISQPPYYLGLVPFVWYISAALAKAHGFRKTSPIFLVLTVVSLVTFVAAMYFHARGMI